LLDLQSPELGLSGGLTPDYPATPGSDAASPRDSPSSEGLSAASTESPPALILSPIVVEQQVDFSTSPSSSDHSIDYILHPTENIFRCDLEDCPTFRDRRSLDRHLRESVAHLSILSPRFVCRCGKHMARWTNFKHHFQRNLANKHVFTSTHYRCICGKPYQDAQALISHQTSHHGRRGRPSLSRARRGRIDN